MLESTACRCSCGGLVAVGSVLADEDGRTPGEGWSCGAKSFYCKRALLAEREGGVQVVKVAGVSLWALFREKKEKPRN